ncbi:ATP-binding protein [Eubacteriales bacterium]|nr:ATP-binding protein [Faecalicatena sp. BF-R-105]GKH49634.1 ATP-binding protein [Eubacteriales bacterium]GKH62275.1 ATP-binding protein [Eubacteriales bacterium]
MGIPVLIMGASGTGKSSSMRNFKAGELGVINVSRKPMPFRSELKPFCSDNYAQIDSVIRRAKTKAIAIDDCQYLMANEFMRNAKVVGYQKFTDIALNFWTLLQTVINDLPPDTIVYFMAHTETDANGNEKMKTIGRMLDEKITLEGLFTIVLKTFVKDGKYGFTTQSNGSDTVKSPIGMFPPEIDNDLKMVDATIRQYYELEDAAHEKT